MNQFELEFINTPYSKREALNFLIANGPELSCSIRKLASIWKWHRSKVERFLKGLELKTIIETEVRSGRTVIKVRANKDFANKSLSAHLDKSETEIETNILSLDQENSSRDNFENKNETSLAQAIQHLSESSETKARQKRDTFVPEEEKKKRSKKRKEEIKEKTFLKESKKEKNFSGNKTDQANQVLVIRKSTDDESSEEAMEVLEEISTNLPVVKRQPNSVTAEDVIDWAEQNLPKSIYIDIEDELEKFKNYQRIKNTTTVKDAVAYFKNWLKKAGDFKQNKLKREPIGGNYHECFKQQNKQARTEFERFFAGGVRALDQLTWS
jgi:DNA-binding transcriptional regulator YhcF (GntR family)